MTRPIGTSSQHAPPPASLDASSANSSDTSSAIGSASEPDGRRRRGRRSRDRLLTAAAEHASQHGLDALSIGALAADVGLSKSGVAALYRTKLDLQLAVIDHAVAVFIGEVVTPTASAPPGTARLVALIDSWASYIRRGVFPGGCFIQRCLAEQTHRPGPLRDAITAAADGWTALLRNEARRAIVDHSLPTDTDADQIAFELDALLAAGNRAHTLGQPHALDRATTACRHRLGVARREDGPRS